MKRRKRRKEEEYGFRLNYVNITQAKNNGEGEDTKTTVNNNNIIQSASRRGNTVISPLLLCVISLRKSSKHLDARPLV